MSLNSIPEWMATATIGALGAVLGFVAKSLYELWSTTRQTRAARLGSLINLSTLLTVSRRIFLKQNERARDLLTLLKTNHPGEVDISLGYEANFSMLYDKFLPEEASLHKLIRNWTEYSLQPLNSAALNWLTNDNLFRTAYISAKDDKKRILAEKLIELNVHLLMWQGKYNAWIPSDPKHALVYLMDEEQHGIGFPTGLDQLIQDVMSDLIKSAPTLPVIKEQK